MRLKATRAMVLGLFIRPALAAVAVAEAPEDPSGRFSMSPVDGGVLRLDKQTGAVAMCAKSGNDWACKPINDQSASGPSSAQARLESENKELKVRIKELEELLETRPPEPPPLNGPLADAPPGGKAQLPTDEEVDQALDYMTRVYKKIRDRIKDLDKPLSQDDHAAPPLTSPPGMPAPKGSL